VAKFTIWGKAVSKAAFERFCEIDQVVTASTDTVRDEIAGRVAARWLEANGDGIIEFRNASDVVLVRLTQP
jgi:hypothetical protein